MTVSPAGCVTAPRCSFPRARWRLQSCYGKALWELGSEQRAGASGFGGGLCAVDQNCMGPLYVVSSQRGHNGVSVSSQLILVPELRAESLDLKDAP